MCAVSCVYFLLSVSRSLRSGVPAYIFDWGCLPSVRDHEPEQRPREAEAVEAKKLVHDEVEVSDTVP